MHLGPSAHQFRSRRSTMGSMGRRQRLNQHQNQISISNWIWDLHLDGAKPEPTSASASPAARTADGALQLRHCHHHAIASIGRIPQWSRRRVCRSAGTRAPCKRHPNSLPKRRVWMDGFQPAGTGHSRRRAGGPDDH